MVSSIHVLVQDLALGTYYIVLLGHPEEPIIIHVPGTGGEVLMRPSTIMQGECIEWRKAKRTQAASSEDAPLVF